MEKEADHYEKRQLTAQHNIDLRAYKIEFYKEFDKSMEVGSDTVKVVARGSDDDSVVTWI